MDNYSEFAICAIASPLEKNYIDEWVSYHKKIGVQHFFICTNDWTWDENKDPDVTTARIDGKSKQCGWYTWFVQNMAKYVGWCAFIDIDEFIKLGSRHKTVLDIVNDNPLVDCICLNWKLFGSSGKHFDGDYSVLRRFTRCQKGFNIHVKSILNLQKLKSFRDDKRIFFRNPHFASSSSIAGLHQYSVNKREIFGAYDKNANFALTNDDAWLAHFFCKTPEEWKLKQERGRADVAEGSSLMYRKDEEFAQHDLNDEECTILKEIIERT